MNRPLPAPVLRYLRELEPKLKARFGVFVEQVLSDTREFLVNDYDSLLSSEPGLDEDSIYQHFVEQLRAHRLKRRPVWRGSWPGV
ncbi:MAG: hypothetical protein U0892_05000 [Pirellulales bacterium]